MHSITYQSEYKTLPIQRELHTLFAHYLTWVKNQEKNHIAWVGISITAMSAVFFPITMSAILFNGAIFKLIIGAMISLSLVVITNLATLHTKYTIPALLLGILMDITLIIASFII
jgi:hypothetical protein